MTNPYIQIGEIYREHGVKGEVKVFLYDSHSHALDEGNVVWIGDPQDKGVKSKVLKVRPHQKWFVTLFDQFSTPEIAKNYRKVGLWIEREQLDLDEDEVLLEDLVGYSVFEGEEKRGDLVGWRGDNVQVLFFQMDDGQEEHLIPWVDDWIVEMDHATKKIVFDFPEGLLEINKD